MGKLTNGLSCSAASLVAVIPTVVAIWLAVFLYHRGNTWLLSLEAPAWVAGLGALAGACFVGFWVWYILFLIVMAIVAVITEL